MSGVRQKSDRPKFLNIGHHSIVQQIAPSMDCTFQHPKMTRQGFSHPHFMRPYTKILLYLYTVKNWEENTIEKKMKKCNKRPGWTKKWLNKNVAFSVDTFFDFLTKNGTASMCLPV
jgi:hypothetical protein